jgi:hypothetical protein
MKNLRVLIITNDEKSSPLAAMMVAENLSALKLGANFFYVKNFTEALNNRDKLIIAGNYDLVYVFADILSITIYDVIDDILYRHENNYFSFLSVSDCLIEVIKNEDYTQSAFLLNEAGPASSSVKELLKEAFKTVDVCNVSPLEITDPVCIFSHSYFYSKIDSFTRRKCESIRSILDHHQIKYYVTDPGMSKQLEIQGARILIYVSVKDLEIVKELAQKSKLSFWQIWIQKEVALKSH